MGKNFYKNNHKFLISEYINKQTFNDYLQRFEKVARSIFEWVNLPKSMNARFLEKSLYEHGQATILYDENYGIINTNCSTSGDINIYGLPTSFNCYSMQYQKERKLYTGLTNENNDLKNTHCILVQNNWERIPTISTLELFALRLYEVERTLDTNIKALKTPVLILVDEKQRLTLLNMYEQYEGNEPAIFGDKNNFTDGSPIQAIKTDAPYLADKLMSYKKEIWNEALTFLGINNIMVDKKERLITDEANSNNELINLNLQSYLAPRQKACDEFNELFGFKGTDKAISVRVRSDLKNIIKQAQSIVQDYKDVIDIENIDTKTNLKEQEVNQNG